MARSLQVEDRARVAEALAKAELQRRQAEKTVAELAAVAASLKPQEPEGDGTVVRFRKWTRGVFWDDDGGYWYAAIRGRNNPAGNGVWYFTQDPTRTGGNKILPGDWEHVLKTVGEKNWDTLEVLS